MTSTKKTIKKEIGKEREKRLELIGVEETKGESRAGDGVPIIMSLSSSFSFHYIRQFR